MRSLVLLVLTPMLTQARVCGANEAQAPVPVASASVTVGAPAVDVAIAKHGGQVVTVDDVQMELIVKGDGEVVAYPVQPAARVSAQAAAPVTLTADAQVTVDVPVQSGGTRPVQLVWVPAETRFVGRVRGARVVERPADVNVTVVAQGRRRHHRIERFAVAPATVVVAAPQPTVVVAAPQPTVVVAPPRPAVVVQRPGVVVAAQAPVVTAAVTVPSVNIQIGGRPSTVVVAPPMGPGRPNQKHRDHGDRGNHYGHDIGRGNPHHGGRHR